MYFKFNISKSLKWFICIIFFSWLLWPNWVRGNRKGTSCKSNKLSITSFGAWWFKVGNAPGQHDYSTFNRWRLTLSCTRCGSHLCCISSALILCILGALIWSNWYRYRSSFKHPKLIKRFTSFVRTNSHKRWICGRMGWRHLIQQEKKRSTNKFWKTGGYLSAFFTQI